MVAALDRVCAWTGYPKTIRVDQNSEFVSRDLDLWTYAKGATLELVASRLPTALAARQADQQRIH